MEKEHSPDLTADVARQQPPGSNFAGWIFLERTLRVRVRPYVRKLKVDLAVARAVMESWSGARFEDVNKTPAFE